LYGFIKELIYLRKRLSEILITGTICWELIDDSQDVIHFSRELNGQKIHAIFNQSSTSYLVDQKNEIILSQNSELLNDGKAEIQQFGFILMCE
ncbi:MAG: alpha-glycosidase, partial [Enterococcus hirae]|nr:alpha-glycosidase [Enterococcus hirae]